MQNMRKDRLMPRPLGRIISFLEGDSRRDEDGRVYACVKRIMKRIIMKHQVSSALTRKESASFGNGVAQYVARERSRP